MLARIAYELFWLGRSVARADHTARLLEGVFHGQLEGQGGDPATTTLSWDALLAMTGVSVAPPVGMETALALLTIDPDQAASIVTSIDGARERARAVRDVISLDMWETINTLHMRLCGDQGPSAADLAREPSAVFDLVRERCSLFWGVQRRTMLRDEGWSYLNAGAELEAADLVVRMLLVTLPGALDSDEHDDARDGPALALLRAVGGLQAFRRATSLPPHLLAVARFLLFETAFPDSIAASVGGLGRALDRADAQGRVATPVLRLRRLAADLDFRRRGTSSVPALLDVLAIVQRELIAVDGDIAERYFAGAVRPALTPAARA